MSDASLPRDPRWGACARDVKALAILATLRAEVAALALGGTWLDVGCGSGLIAAELAQHVATMHAIDPEPWERWSSLAASRPNLHFHVGSCRELTNRIGAGCVDVAICNQVYEHVDSVVDLLAQLRQVLATHGVCYFAGPNLLWPIEPHVHLPFVHWLPRRAVIGVLQSIGVSRISGLDAWSLDVWRLQRLFAQAGFSARPAFSARARAGYALGEGGLPMRLAAALPGPLVDLLRPLLPAFVFILRKRP